MAIACGYFNPIPHVAAAIAAKSPTVHLGAVPYTRCPRIFLEHWALEQIAAQETMQIDLLGFVHLNILGSHRISWDLTMHLFFPILQDSTLLKIWKDGTVAKTR